MKPIGFLSIAQAIFILTQEINAAKLELDRLDERIFVDEDFTDYNALSHKRKRETDSTNQAFTSAEKDGILKSKFKEIYKLNPDQARSKQDNDKSEIDLIENIDTKFRRIDKTSAEIAKVLQRQVSFPKIIPMSLLEKHLISLLRRQNKKVSNENIEIVINDRKNKKETEEKNKETGLKTDSAAKGEKHTNHDAGVRDRHNHKVNEIMQFLEKNYLSTNYIHDEMERIKKYGEVKDQLRRLVIYLEQPENAKLKESVLKCFYDTKKVIDRKRVDIWNVNNPNNLIIHNLRDPYMEYV